MLSTLPVENWLEIIQCLPLTTITLLSALSKSWAAFMATNEPSIYRGVSKRYGFTSEGGANSIDPPEGWKAWFIHRFQIELRWIGKLAGNPYVVKVPETLGNFFGINIDEEHGYIINTFFEGGLVVLDICDHSILWSLGEGFCGGRIRCEYDGGYIIFKRYGEYEVWRRRVDVLDVPEEAWPSGLQNQPGEEMIEGNRIAEDRYFDENRSRDPSHLRGQFIPWARLLIPEATSAFRLVRGTLLVFSSHTAFLYDIEKAELQQEIGMDGRNIGHLRHVDLSDQHIFIVRTLQLSVYDRVTGLPVLSIPAGKQSWDFYASPENQWGCTEHTFNHGELGFRQPVCPNRSDRDDHFRDAHVSSCGKHLVILTSSYRIILVQDFWRLFQASSSSPASSPPALRDISNQVDFHLEPPSSQMLSHLAYDHGRITVGSVFSMHVLTLDSLLKQLGEITLPKKDISLQTLQNPARHDPPWPNIRVRKVWFGKKFGRKAISCLRLAETKLYVSVFPDDSWSDRGENMWCYDFASPPTSVAAD